MDLSVVIRVANDLRIVDCVNSVDEPAEIVVAAYDPKERMRSTLESLPVNTCYINKPGIGLANNVGIAAASHEKVLLMDADCVFEPGAIRLMYDALDHSKLVKSHVRYSGTNRLSKMVAEGRSFHGLFEKDSVFAFTPGLAFRKEIINNLSYYFDNDLLWAEDAEFDKRVRDAGLKVKYLSEAVVSHAPLNVRQDLKAAYKYGTGYATAFLKGAFTKEDKRIPTAENFLKYLQLVAGKQNTPFFIYMSLWSVVRAAGFYSEIVPNRIALTIEHILHS